MLNCLMDTNSFKPSMHATLQCGIADPPTPQTGLVIFFHQLNVMKLILGEFCSLRLKRPLEVSIFAIFNIALRWPHMESH